MSKGNTFENDLLKLVFNAVAIANIADNASSSPLTALWVSLHTSDPAEAGNQGSNEATYGAYARVSVNRTTSGWTISNNSVSPAADVTFPQATSGSESITHAAIGTAATGGGKLLYYGTVTPNIAVTTGVTPRLTTSSTITED